MYNTPRYSYTYVYVRAISMIATNEVYPESNIHFEIKVNQLGYKNFIIFI